MKKLVYVIIVSIALTGVFAMAMYKIEEEKRQKQIDTERGFILISSLMSRDFETAKKYFDTLRANGRDNEIFYLEEGWMYDMLNEKEKSKRCFLKSLKLQEEKIDTMKKGLRRDVELLQRSMLIQALYGDEAHKKSLDSLRGKLFDPSCLDFDGGLEYKKEKMFVGYAYKNEYGWHVCYSQSGDSITQQQMRTYKKLDREYDSLHFYRRK